MDSRLLNVFHDDPFDGNYVKYDTDTQFWSSESETLGLQLTETLHGILPITPTEVVSTNIYGSSLLKEEDYSLESKHDSNTNSIIYGDYEDAAQLGMTNKRQLSTQQNDDDYDSEFSESTEDEDGDDEDEAMDIEHFRGVPGVVTFNDARSYSRSTFRSRTDSSSIGDYESHSSDYDDESDDDDIMQFNSSENDLRLQAADIGDDFTLHSDANELKKTMEDVDAFGIQLDANTFDLAAFITQDDQFDCHQSQAPVAIAQPSRVDLGQVKMPAKSSDSDSDSDVIVDVETVENDDAEFWDRQTEQPIEYTDNVKSDPCWSPNNLKSEKKEVKSTEPNFKSNFTVIPSKRQSDFLKRKFGLGRGKNISMHRNPSKTPIKSDSKCKSQTNNNNNVEEKTKNPIIQPRIADKKVENLILKPEKKIEIPTPAKKIENIPAIKHDIPPVKIKVEKPTPELKQPPPVIVKVEKSPAAVQTPPISNGKCMNILKHDTVSIKTEPEEVTTLDEPVEEVEVVTQNRQMYPQKRKLNIEEYKKRRENPSAFPPSSKNIQTVDIAKIRKTEASVQTISKPIPTKPLTNKPQQTAAVTSIVKSLKESQGTKRFIDPITEAKNKVLRMQELKKAQQIKIIDSTVSSKVGRVTRLPPLKDIVKDTYRSGDGDEEGGTAMTNPDYEEIINVSTGCNTDITIPPGGYNSVLPKVGKNASRSLLKSSVLLANISNSFERVRCDDTVKISSNSLLVSIQDVVVKNSAPLPTEPIKAPQGTSATSDHGEDKVIMHLRKDRIRKRKFTQSTQTELLPEFPTLPPPVVESLSYDSSSRDRSRKGRRRQYRARQHSYSSENESREGSRSSSRSVGKRSRRHRSSISSSYSESDEYPKRTHRFSGSSSQSRDRSRSSSAGRRSRSRSFDRVYRNSRSRSRSKSRSTRGGTVDTNRHIDRNVSAPAVEERRIVYVGRIEQETTKEILRRKFVAYGPIKQITIHYKDTGMKYGFVTYEKSEDAFRVIDSGQKDETINMYDISFGGRRAFCRASYADLDNAGINTYQSYVVPRPVVPPKEEDSFEALLLKVKAKLNATKSSSSSSKI